MAFDKILKFPEYCEKELGSVTIDKASDGRFGIKVYSDGIIKIMESNPRRFFLKELIKKIRNRDCTIDDVKKIFEKESPNYVCDEIDNSEFQYVVYFLDKDIDEYKYCFTFDSMGSYYHRVIDYDYEKLIRHNCGL
ncbi:hypothetical protein IMSAG049_01614 [Clostridiales bacterium]|nr:hypothetical protein IMSAG049_01614 [Clostridiales bacterium]